MEGGPAGAVAAGSRGARIGRAMACVVLLGLPVFVLSLAIRQEFEPLLRTDAAVVRWATGFTQLWGLAPALIVLQTVSHPTVVYVLSTLVALWAWIAKGMKGLALWAFSTMMVAWIAGEVMKLAVQRARPALDLPLSLPPGYSFPSGHALNITVATGVLLLLLWSLLSSPGRVLAVSSAIVIVVVVGLDRIFLGVHFPSDVLAGYVLGCCITFSSWIGFVGPMGGISSSVSSDRR